jgi:carboxylate-amine ligase
MSGTLEARDGAATLDYRPGTGWDEARDAAGLRPGYPALASALAEVDLPELARLIADRLAADGVSFGSGADARPFVVDPIPRLIGSAEWELIERGAAQRARALAAFVADVYGEREIVRAGRIPARAIETATGFEPLMAGVPCSSAGFVVGLDLVRGASGELAVLEDNARTPSGIAYALAARAVRERFLPLAPAGPAAQGTLPMLAGALCDAAPAGVDEPRVVVLSDGPANTAFHEHRVLARGLDAPLVGPRDLLVRRGRLCHLDGSAVRQIDVAYRRTDEDRLRDDDGRATWLAQTLLGPVRRGTLTVVNPLGAGVCDDKLTHAYVGEMVRFYLGEEPLLPSVPTHDLGDGDTRSAVLGSLGDYVIKPRSGLGGHGVAVCSELAAPQRDEIARRIEEEPDAWVAQERVAISTHPTLSDGRLEPRHVDLRPFAIGGGAGASTAPVALTRVALERGSLVVNSAAGGGAKDTLVCA